MKYKYAGEGYVENTQRLLLLQNYRPPVLFLIEIMPWPNVDLKLWHFLQRIFFFLHSFMQSRQISRRIFHFYPRKIISMKPIRQRSPGKNSILLFFPNQLFNVSCAFTSLKLLGYERKNWILIINGDFFLIFFFLNKVSRDVQYMLILKVL